MKMRGKAAEVVAKKLVKKFMKEMDEEVSQRQIKELVE